MPDLRWGARQRAQQSVRTCVEVPFPRFPRLRGSQLSLFSPDNDRTTRRITEEAERSHAL